MDAVRTHLDAHFQSSTTYFASIKSTFTTHSHLHCTTMSANVLSNRDINAQIKTTEHSDAKEPKSMEYHRQVLESRMKDEQ